jgi:hypothetical protein
MADTKQSPPRQVVKDFVRKSPSEAPGPAHPCDAPGLSPIEFLHAVYCDPHLPMSIRIDAARGLLPYTEPRPACAPSSHVGCTIVIGGLGPCTTEPEPRSPADPTKNHSENLLSANTTLTRDGRPGAPQNLTTIPNTPPLIDYSTPPTPAELQEIKAAINRLRPDLAHLPIPEPRLCQCGHWLFGPCPLGEQCRDRSKLN